ncbi:MAG: thymidylate synthase [Parvibaculum sp.]|jgi:thymidylate synthase|uniref:thymidylate synthase n=1 Tax=Parvibaculum sp. TaxID=2024848 RepID=UPI0032EC545F
MRNTHPSILSAYKSGLQDLLEAGANVPSVTDPLSIASNFGRGDRPSVELLGYSFEVLSPSPTVITSPARNFNVGYYVGLLLWTLSASDSLEWIAYYDKNASKFSQDQATLCGAFGKRLMDYNSIDQLKLLSERLRVDPASRRAVGLLLTPEDGAQIAYDYSCAIAIQYFVREDALTAITYMRAQQALTILPYDAFVFMGLQSFLASKLGIPCGRYIHIAGTFHVYESEKQIAEAASRDATGNPLGHIDALDGSLDELMAIEKELREAVLAGSAQTIERAKAHRFAVGSFAENARDILVSFAEQELLRRRASRISNDH